MGGRGCVFNGVLRLASSPGPPNGSSMAAQSEGVMRSVMVS